MGFKRKDEFFFGYIELVIFKGYLCVDVWQIIGNVGFKFMEKVIKNWIRLMNGLFLKLNFYV